MVSQRKTEIQYLFIDGAYFREVVQDFSNKFFGGKTIPIDYNAISAKFYKTFYYDCLPPKKKVETEEVYKARIKPEEEFFDSLRMLPHGFHVYKGTTVGEGGRIRQKKVDTMIAIDMLTHSFNGNMDKVTLLAGDLDFKPLVDALVQQGMFITLWYHPLNTSKELFYAADSRIELNFQSIIGLTEYNFKINNSNIVYENNLKDKCVNGYSLLKKGKIDLKPELEIEVYKKEGSFLVVYQPPHPSKVYFAHFEHHNQNVLENYIIDRFQKKINWVK